MSWRRKLKIMWCCGVMLTFFKELKAKEKKERRRSSFDLHKGKSVL